MTRHPLCIRVARFGPLLPIRAQYLLGPFGVGLIANMPPLLSEEEAGLDPYALLGLETAASEKEVRKAYKMKSLKYHPDKVRSLSIRLV